MQDTTTTLPRLTTAEELAARTGLTRARVYSLCREGKIPHARIGRSVRFDPSAVAEWLASGGTGYDGGR